jgi:hypothetical protein
VRLNWAVRGYSTELSRDLTRVSVMVDGQPVDDIAVDLGPVTDGDTPGATSLLQGAVTFPAPADPGRHDVVLTVVPDAEPAAEPGPLRTTVEVLP